MPMRLLECTLDTPPENLALDAALLEACEAGELAGSILRLWELPEYFVVLGRSSDPTVEVNLAACRAERVPVLRRDSGGGTVLAGPGCLMYAVVLGYDEHAHCRAVDQAHEYVLGRVIECLAPLGVHAHMAGTSDLVLAGHAHGEPVKFSGNALRCKRSHFLYHGTLLYDFALERLDHLLAATARAPQYRRNRSHGEFVTNLPLTADELRQALADGWQADAPLSEWPQARVAEIVQTKYSRDPLWKIFGPE